MAHSNIKTRITRKSSYIELVAAIERKTFSTGSFTYPLFRTSKAPLLWSLPYLSLRLQPSLDVSRPRPLGWLNTHVSMMFSASQRRLRDDRHSPAPVEQRTAVELKDSLLSLFMQCKAAKPTSSVLPAPTPEACISCCSLPLSVLISQTEPSS